MSGLWSYLIFLFFASTEFCQPALAVDIFHYLNTDYCRRNYLSCRDIDAHVCCDLGPTTYAMSSECQSLDVNGYPDGCIIFQTSPCSCEESCLGDSGKDHICFKYANVGEHIGGAMWVYDHNYKRDAMENMTATRVQQADVAGFWDLELGLHREVDIGPEVPANVSASIREAIGAGLHFHELDEVLKTYELPPKI